MVIQKIKKKLKVVMRYQSRMEEIKRNAELFKEREGRDIFASWTDFEVSELAVFSLGITGPKDYPKFKLMMLELAAEQLDIKIEGEKQND